MVNEGQVGEEQKYGNDNADAAADNGATVSQKSTYAMARHYSFRHYYYRKLMARIQKMIVELRKHDNELRLTLRKEQDPFETGRSEAMLIPLRLEYETQENAGIIKFNEVGKQWTSSDQQRRQVEQVRQFLSRMTWKKDGPPEEGGITWLELYLLYSYHGGNEDEQKLTEKDPLRQMPFLQKQFSDFKLLLDL